MKRLCQWLSIFVLAATTLAAPHPAWQPGKSPLKTHWANEVSPDKVLPEYPRPQMVRQDWMNLNGLWDYAILEQSASAPKAYAGKILVPYPIESALSGVTKQMGDTNRLWYRRTFELPDRWEGKRILLHFGAVDWETTVYVNGKSIGTHCGGYDPFSFDITSALNPGGIQQLVVSVGDPTEGGQPRGKQRAHPQGIFYTPCSGIWQTVWLEPVAPAAITDIKITPEVDSSAVRLTVLGAYTTEKHRVRATASRKTGFGSKRIETVEGNLGEELVISVPNPVLWSPENPFLYDLDVQLLSDGKTVDSVKSYFGMRKIEVAKDERGVNRLMLNGKFVFQMGPLDQGYWPDGIYTAPTDEALRYDIEITKKLGFNMTRKHVKTEPARWYYWCDKLGLLVWQDMPSADNRTAEDKQQFERELKQLVTTHYNSPSIIMWVVFNEGWGQFDTERLTAMVKSMDPSRIVNNASGWVDKNVGDVMDRHDYPGPSCPTPEPARAVVLGEFGGLGLGVDGHTWTQKTWGYQGMADKEALTTRYVNLLRRVWDLKEKPGLSAAVYTQITDVESECNGLLTYDREIIKTGVKDVASANAGTLPPAPKREIILPNAQTDSVQWRYTTEKPSDDWNKPEFDDSKWKQGVGGFGSTNTPGGIVKTDWNTSDIWLRRHFNLKDTNFDDLLFVMHHDEYTEIYINGVIACKARGFTTAYEDFSVRSGTLQALKTGDNVMAVHCQQTEGGQYIDVGLVNLVPQKTSK